MTITRNPNGTFEFSRGGILWAGFATRDDAAAAQYDLERGVMPVMPYHEPERGKQQPGDLIAATLAYVAQDDPLLACLDWVDREAARLEEEDLDEETEAEAARRALLEVELPASFPSEQARRDWVATTAAELNRRVAVADRLIDIIADLDDMDDETAEARIEAMYEAEERMRHGTLIDAGGPGRVRVEREVCNDYINKKKYGKEIGTNYTVGETLLAVDDDGSTYLRAFGEGLDPALVARDLADLMTLLGDRRVRAAMRQAGITAPQLPLDYKRAQYEGACNILYALRAALECRDDLDVATWIAGAIAGQQDAASALITVDRPNLELPWTDTPAATSRSRYWKSPLGGAACQSYTSAATTAPLRKPRPMHARCASSWTTRASRPPSLRPIAAPPEPEEGTRPAAP
jgi:hypothetical protein